MIASGWIRVHKGSFARICNAGPHHGCDATLFWSKTPAGSGQVRPSGCRRTRSMCADQPEPAPRPAADSRGDPARALLSDASRDGPGAGSRLRQPEGQDRPRLTTRGRPDAEGRSGSSSSSSTGCATLPIPSVADPASSSARHLNASRSRHDCSGLQDRVDQLRQEAQEATRAAGTGRAMIEQYNATCRGDADGDSGAKRTPPSRRPGRAGPRCRTRRRWSRRGPGAQQGDLRAPLRRRVLPDHRAGDIRQPRAPRADLQGALPQRRGQRLHLDPQASLDTAVAPDGAAYTALPARSGSKRPMIRRAAASPQANPGLKPGRSRNAARARQERRRGHEADVRRNVPAGPAGATDATPKPARTGKAARSAKPANTIAGRTPAEIPPSPRVVDQGSSAPPDADPDAITRQFRRSEPTF